MAHRWTFKKDPLKLEKILRVIHNQIWNKNYGVMMALQKKYFIEPAESCPHWLKNYIMEEVRSASPEI